MCFNATGRLHLFLSIFNAMTKKRRVYGPRHGGLADWNCGMHCSVVLAFVPSRMEDTMCWEIDYNIFVEQQKAQEIRTKQERRAGVFGQLLNEANN